MAKYPLGRYVAELHLHEVNHDIHGYTQGSGRNGSGGTEKVKILDIIIEIMKGDRDCSSSAIEVWKKILAYFWKGTKYEHILDGATYTGNMRKVFTASGLFDAVPFSMANLHKYAKPGDVLLNDSHHTGIYQGNDKVSEFLSNEFGGILNGKVGDQTGRESRVRDVSAYSKNWQWILVYNGKADRLDPMVYEMILRTNVRTGRSLLYKVVNKLEPGMKVVVTDTKTDKLGKVWGHYGRYRWFVISTKRKVRAKRIE